LNFGTIKISTTSTLKSTLENEHTHKFLIEKLPPRPSHFLNSEISNTNKSPDLLETFFEGSTKSIDFETSSFLPSLFESNSESNTQAPTVLMLHNFESKNVEAHVKESNNTLDGITLDKQKENASFVETIWDRKARWFKNIGSLFSSTGNKESISRGDHEMMAPPSTKKQDDPKNFFETRVKCRQIKKKVCKKIPKKRCSGMVRKCENKHEKKCQLKSEKSCKRIPKKNCKQVRKRVCNKFPTRGCKLVPKKNCVKVPKESCKKKQVTRQVEICFPKLSTIAGLQNKLD